jgi:hypothetical protein
MERGTLTKVSLLLQGGMCRHVLETLRNFKQSVIENKYRTLHYYILQSRPTCFDHMIPFKLF